MPNDTTCLEQLVNLLFHQLNLTKLLITIRHLLHLHIIVIKLHFDEESYRNNNKSKVKH